MIYLVFNLSCLEYDMVVILKLKLRVKQGLEYRICLVNLV